VGAPSWGKGLVQTVYNLSYGAGLALTTAKYYTPSGRLIQRDYTSYFDYYTHADAGSPEVTGKAVDPSQIFETDLGRKVYGGGGITPDVIVQDDELLPFEQFLLARNAYLNFAIDYTNRNKSRIKSADWRPGPELVQELRDWVVKEKIATAQEIDEALQKEEIRDYSQLQVRAEIMNSLFGQEARHRVLSEGDTQLQSALNLFGRAATMLAQRQELGVPNPRIQRGEENPKGRL
jgi:carboxyl-terminal processing protease